MKTELILLLIHLVSLTLTAVVVPPVVDHKVTALADKKDVTITSTESVESAESIESLGSNDPKVISSTPVIEKNEENESAESTESSVLDNDVLKTSSTFHRRYHYPRYSQYYRRPVASGYYNRYPQGHSVNRYSYNRPSLPAYYTQPTYWSQYSSYYDSDSGSGSSSGGGDSGGDSGGGGCRRKRGARSKRCGGGGD